MSLQHRIEINEKPSSTDDRETCVVNVTVFPVTHSSFPFSIPSFSFSFHQLRHFPRSCKQKYEQLLRLQPFMRPTRKFLADKIVKHAVNLANESIHVTVKFGYVVDARLYILRGMYMRAGGEEVMCPVCLENLTPWVEVYKLPCSHVFHTGCIDRWCKTSKTCPYCRHELEYEDCWDDDEDSCEDDWWEEDC